MPPPASMCPVESDVRLCEIRPRADVRGSAVLSVTVLLSHGSVPGIFCTVAWIGVNSGRLTDVSAGRMLCPKSTGMPRVGCTIAVRSHGGSPRVQTYAGE